MSAVLLDTIQQRLVSLKMPCALEELDTVVRQLEAGQMSALQAIEALLSVELSFRETRRIKVALGTSRLMPPKTLESFDFAFQPSLDRERIYALAGLNFVARAEIVHLLGPPGTGKSHLACALGGGRRQSGQQRLPLHPGRPGRFLVAGPSCRTTRQQASLLHSRVLAHRR